MRKSRAKPKWVKSLAQKQTDKLLSLAKEEIDKNPERSKRYSQLAKKTATKYNLKINKKTICPNCGILLIPGKNLKVRTNKQKQIIYICQACGQTQKTGYSRETLKKDKKS
ncbi:ribonuclease P [archaeon]|nr:ribonuclease P [archaeon]